MRTLCDVKAIEYRHGRVFRITFEDGPQGEVDFSEYLDKGPIFEPLKEDARFPRARIEGTSSRGRTVRISHPRPSARRLKRRAGAGDTRRPLSRHDRRRGNWNGPCPNNSTSIDCRYLLSYEPAGVRRDDGWRRVEVRVKGRKAKVVTRTGYLAAGRHE